jgi:hypothetical protein
VSLGDERTVPQGAVLVREAHELAVGVDPRRRPGLGQQQQRQQPDGFGLVG